jgi:hypothetical protein
MASHRCLAAASSASASLNRASTLLPLLGSCRSSSRLGCGPKKTGEKSNGSVRGAERGEGVLAVGVTDGRAGKGRVGMG